MRRRRGHSHASWLILGVVLADRSRSRRRSIESAPTRCSCIAHPGADHVRSMHFDGSPAPAASAFGDIRPVCTTVVVRRAGDAAAARAEIELLCGTVRPRGAALPASVSVRRVPHARRRPCPRRRARRSRPARWQQRALAAMAHWTDGPFLLSAAPGRGQDRARRSSSPARCCAARSSARVAVVCPTTPLTRQWAAAAARLGLQLAPDAREPAPAADFDGVAVTYARVAQSAARWAPQCSPGTLVIADEAHHLGDDLAWGTGFERAFGAAARWLLLSGTPFRSDATPIPGVRYDATASPCPTSPTPTRTPCATASAARSRSSPTTARCSGVGRRRRSRRPSPTR